MTIEEIRKAKQEAEHRIQKELQQLQEKTGMQVADLRVQFLDAGSFHAERRVVANLTIDLRVP